MVTFRKLAPAAALVLALGGYASATPSFGAAHEQAYVSGHAATQVAVNSKGRPGENKVAASFSKGRPGENQVAVNSKGRPGENQVAANFSKGRPGENAPANSNVG
jgi:uncharacterized low-complexity protein